MSRQKLKPGGSTPDPATFEQPALRIPQESTRVDSPNRRTIKVTWGEEVHQPVQFNGFRIGGLELQFDVAPSQTIEEAYELAFDRLEALAEKQFERKLEGFISRLQRAGQSVRASAASKK